MKIQVHIEIDGRPRRLLLAAVGNCVTKCVRNSKERQRSVCGFANFRNFFFFKAVV